LQQPSSDESDEPSGQSDVMSTSLHPVVIRWHGEGQNVFLSGSFDGWKTKIPLVRRCRLLSQLYGIVIGLVITVHCSEKFGSSILVCLSYVIALLLFFCKQNLAHKIQYLQQKCHII